MEPRTVLVTHGPFKVLSIRFERKCFIFIVPFKSNWIPGLVQFSLWYSLPQSTLLEVQIVFKLLLYLFWIPGLCQNASGSFLGVGLYGHLDLVELPLFQSPSGFSSLGAVLTINYNISNPYTFTGAQDRLSYIRFLSPQDFLFLSE